VATLDELKAKYASVIQVVTDKQIQLANLHLQDGKLFIKGTAPSQEAANAVWNEIKRINPKGDDIMAEFPIDTTLKTTPAAATTKTYKVKPGDTLSKISQQFYGTANDYKKIFDANRDQLSDPNKIQVGQELKIPA
jgi:nucleoid-associated protein YgaU